LGEGFFRQLPERPGVYLMRDAAEVVLYVGKAKSLRHRLNSYRVANPDRMGQRHLRLLRQVVRIELQECADEAAALAREAELLRTLKPKFNRAGVWAGPPRFLVWRATEMTLQLAVTATPTPGWQEFGPCGGGVVYLRSALVRLLWFALNPSLGSISMPAGWWQGRLAAIATLDGVSGDAPFVLAKLLDGDTDGFVLWIGERTQSLAYAYDRETRDADLETVATLIQAKLRRTASFQDPDQSVTTKPRDADAAWLFPEDDWSEP
jgi:predicted GIY-YIG superfamily endonuclease